MMRTAAIYTRVSSDKQTENQSLDVQRVDCGKLAEREGYEVYQVYEDGGYSGMTTDRPGLQELVTAAEARAFDAVIVWDQSRFGRDFIDVELNLRRLQRLGIAFLAVHGPAGDDETAKLTRRILGAVYEMELDTAKRRKRAGRRMKVEAGRGWPGGQLPYGYASETFRGPDGKTNTRLFPHAEESPVVRHLFDLYTQHGYSANEIAKCLNAKGIRTKRDRLWWAAQVIFILQNDAYTGRTYYFKTTPDGRPVDRALWLEIKVPALVDDEAFQKAQALLCIKRGRSRGPKNTTWPEADLKGLIHCECGLHMVSLHQREKKTTRHYYKCLSKHNYSYADHKCPRSPGSVRMGPIDEAVWEALLAEMDDGERLERRFTEYYEEQHVSQAAKLETSERIRLELGKLERREQEVWGIYDSGEEGWDRDMLKRRLADLGEKREALERRLKEVAASERSADQLRKTANEIRKMAREYRDRLHDLPREKRREVLKLLLQRVTLHFDNSLTIEWRFPAPSNRENIVKWGEM